MEQYFHNYGMHLIDARHIDNISDEELKGGVNMCATLDYFETKGREKGREEGVSLSAKVFKQIKAGNTSNKVIAAACQCTEQEVERIRSEFEI